MTHLGGLFPAGSRPVASRRMAANDELVKLLGRGELAAFRGKPADAVGVLEGAVVLAQSQGRGAEVVAAAWLLGVALAAGGRYGGALTVLSPLAESDGAAGAPPERRLFAALAGATIAWVHRQLGRQGVAREADRGALSLTDGTGEAAFDALLGLASGAVGLDDGEEAAARLAAAAAGRARGGRGRGGRGSGGRGRGGRGRGGRWCGARRRGPVVASAGAPGLGGRRGVDAGRRRRRGRGPRPRRRRGAERARAPRHVAKGLLIQGIAEVGAGRDGAAATLRRAAGLAESLGCLPLVWSARALLGALLTGDDREEGERSLAAARSAVRTLAADLPPGVRAQWLARADVTALLQGREDVPPDV